jgi:hypothetical protein
MSNNHEKTATAIEAGTPGYAQMEHDGELVSWHPIALGHSFSGGPPGWTVTDARAKFIDKWAKGEASVTPGTFSDDQIEHRASQWEHGNGPHISPGHRDPQFAADILTLKQS